MQGKAPKAPAKGGGSRCAASSKPPRTKPEKLTESKLPPDVAPHYVSNPDAAALVRERDRISQAAEAAESRDAWDKFLHYIARYPHRGTALDRAGLSVEELQDKLASDAHFADRYSKAFDCGLDSMEDEVVRRAVLGVDEPVYQGGLCVGFKTRYSDTLLMFHLEAHRKKFRGTDDTARKPLSEEAKNTIRQLFEEVADDAPTAPPPKQPGRRGRKPKE